MRAFFLKLPFSLSPPEKMSDSTPNAACLGNKKVKTVVLLCNTGSPAAPTKEAVANYLTEFLGDRRVVEMSPLLWQPILRGIIVPRRAQASADRYKTVWTQKGSPLMAVTADTAAALQKEFGDDVLVSWAMCYGVRRIEDELARLSEMKPEGILILPMFAQYATQTTEAVFDGVGRARRDIPDLPPVMGVKDYFEEDAYIQVLADRVRAHWDKVGPLGENGKLMVSFHSIPAASSERGDPYEAQCGQTAERLRLALGLTQEQVVPVFQSRFGRAKWLEPFAADVAPALGKAGLKRLDVICPGFAADCLETLEEINTELRHFYEEAGGKGFHYIECLNAEPDAVALYAGLIRKALTGQKGLVVP